MTSATNADFTAGPLADFGSTVSRTPVTVVVNNVTGQKAYTDGTPANISAVFENANKKYDFKKSGLTEGADARMFVIGTTTLNKNDKITHNSIVYRVDNISERLFGANSIFKTVLLFEIA